MINREGWLLYALKELELVFHEKGYRIPKVRVSCAFPYGSRNNAIVGQCWGSSCSEDGTNEIFITPKYDSSFDVLDTLSHELVHAVDDCKHRHGPEFKKIALTIGLEGKMIHASAGQKLKERLKTIAAKLEKNYGKYPHASLKIPTAQKAENRRLHPKAICPICKYTVVLSLRFLTHGPPICPKDKVLMKKDGNWGSVD